MIEFLILSVYLTGYSYWDNTPPGSAIISNPVVHEEAGGRGTYSDPITVAVGKEDRDGSLPYGTILYLPKLLKYVIVEDYCSACTRNWLDIWVDGRWARTKEEVDECMRGITGTYSAIVNPTRYLPVSKGPIC